MELHADWHNCLCHDDVHLKNWYVAGNGEMGLSDWQDVSRGHWARDVAYAVSTALTVEDRRAWEQDLIKYYLEELRASGGPQVGFDEAWKVYRRQLITALDALVNEDTAEDQERLALVEMLWAEYEALLGSATRTEEEMPEHD